MNTKTYISDNPEAYLNALKQVSAKISTRAEAQNLVRWILCNMPYMTHLDDNFDLFKAIDERCHYFKGSPDQYELALFPAIVILSLCIAYGIGNDDDFCNLNDLYYLNLKVIADETIAEHQSFEQFKDKYRSILGD